jgi:hypothetical protein
MGRRWAMARDATQKIESALLEKFREDLREGLVSFLLLFVGLSQLSGYSRHLVGWAPRASESADGGLEPIGALQAIRWLVLREYRSLTPASR